MARTIQIFEYEKLTLHKNERNECLTISELAKLYEFNDRNDNKYFTGIRDGIKFMSYVGVIQIGGLTIEILPKADRNTSFEKNPEYNKWRGALLNMLAICKKIKVDSVSEASLERRYYSILDLYFEIFLDEVTILLRNGLIKKYHNQKCNTTVLKGRILFSKNIQQNLIHQERFFTAHQIYDYEHTINQILLKALSVLKNIVVNSDLRDRIERIKLDFPEIREIQISKLHFDRIKESRKSVPYTSALQIAKMIILNYSPDIKNGQENMLTLLFDMNKLWEEYVYRMLQRSQKENWSVSFQNSQAFWENKFIVPDLVVTKNIKKENEERFVIDTKWKVIDYRYPSDDDLKQMYAYNLYWDAGKSMLLYPKTKEFPEKFGIYHKGRENNCCKLGFVNVLDGNGKLDLNIGTLIMDKLEAGFSE